MAYLIGLLIIFTVWLSPIIWAWKTGHPDRKLITLLTLIFGPVGFLVSMIIISYRNRATPRLGDTGVYKCENYMNIEETQNALSTMDSQSPGNVLNIHGRSGILESLGIIALGVLFLCFDSQRMTFYHHIIFFILGAFLVSCGLLILWLSIPQIGKPLLVLSREGFEVPRFGFIPWTAVKAIYKRDVTYRGIINFSPILNFIIADPKPSERQFHVFGRPNPRLRDIPVFLRNCDMKPDDILSVAQQLWGECTGRDHVWTSPDSDEISEKELKNLESLSMELSDPRLREEALRAINELRTSKSNPVRPDEMSVKQGPQIPILEEPSVFEPFRLYRDLKSRDPDVKKQAMDKIRLRHIEEAKLITETKARMSDPTYCNDVRKEFRHRKLLFRCISLSLIPLSILFMVIAVKGGMPRDAFLTLWAVGFCFSYFYVARRIWRCPACNSRFDIGRSSNIGSCPRCKAILQA
jgi:hypothetical protein